MRVGHGASRRDDGCRGKEPGDGPMGRAGAGVQLMPDRDRVIVRGVGSASSKIEPPNFQRVRASPESLFAPAKERFYLPMLFPCDLSRERKSTMNVRPGRGPDPPRRSPRCPKPCLPCHPWSDFPSRGRAQRYLRRLSFRRLPSSRLGGRRPFLSSLIEPYLDWQRLPQVRAWPLVSGPR